MSLGKDLAAKRKRLGLTLEEIQGQIKIPTHIISSIEDDSIFEQIETNKTYTRSFVRSYAKALGIHDQAIVDALDSIEAGLYNPGSVLDDDIALSAEEEADSDESLVTSDESKIVLQKPDIEEKDPKPTPTVENVNWADLGKRFNAPAASTKIILPVAIAFVIIVLAILIFIYREPIMGFFSSDDPIENAEVLGDEEATPLVNDALIDSTALDATSTEDLIPEVQDTPQELLDEETEDSDEPASPRAVNLPFNDSLTETLTVSVYAAFDKLEPVRVTSDFNWRTNPFWMEQGQAYNFNFTDTLLVRGQYTRMLLMFNGHVIEEPFENYYDDSFDSIMLTRTILSDEKYFVQPSAVFPYEVGPPDSLVFPLSN
ncbi:MAG: helix-turn-helix domain-containing protein [Balneolaceae bacterium]|nr:helix-turn-helix domain-containing protein [Balneolaceae bacterium]